MIDLYVQYSVDTESSHHSAEQYGDWSEERSFTVKSVSLTSSSRYNEEKQGLPDVKAGDVVFVLYMIYSSGDSFGSSSGNGEILWVFKDAALGVKAKEKFEKDNDGRDPSYSLEIETDTGEVIKMSNPAYGYFENMSSINLEAFLVNP